MAKRKRVNLALQGGGAHGAYAWGILDCLLADGRLEIEGISATSAGAMNAVVLSHGYSLGGNEGAREKLAEFWHEVSEAGNLYSPVRALPWERWFHGHNMEASPSYHAFQAMSRIFSPYQFNPLNFNPLRDVLEAVVEFDHLCQCHDATKLYISATNVRTGKIRVFTNEEMTADAVLASACLPFLFQAVEIDGEHYWDGGYMGNPAIFPLIYHSESKDVIVVHINPIERAELPTTASEIFNRINEISFNSSLMREMRAIAFVTGLIDKGVLNGNSYNRMLIHSIRSDDDMAKLGVASKFSSDWNFLCQLRDAGSRRAGEWLTENFDNVGTRSSVDLAEAYL
jgi:NTE family protein